MIQSVITYACTFWVGGVNKKYLAKKTSKSTKTSVSYDFFSIFQYPTGALEMLLNSMPINDEFILLEAVKGTYRLSCVNFGLPRRLVQQEKPKVM